MVTGSLNCRNSSDIVFANSNILAAYFRLTVNCIFSFAKIEAKNLHLQKKNCRYLSSSCNYFLKALFLNYWVFKRACRQWRITATLPFKMCPNFFEIIADSPFSKKKQTKNPISFIYFAKALQVVTNWLIFSTHDGVPKFFFFLDKYYMCCRVSKNKIQFWGVTILCHVQQSGDRLQTNKKIKMDTLFIYSDLSSNHLLCYQVKI